MKFLCENKANIDIGKQIIIIDGRDYEIKSENTFTYNPDNRLADNTKILLLKEQENQLDDIIQNAKDKNPEVGKIDIIKHSIVLNGTLTNKVKEYPVHVKIKNDVQNHINELINKGIIIRKHSNYISPAFVLQKSNGQLILVVDYRALNKITVKTTHFMPKLNEIHQICLELNIFQKLISTKVITR
ncbi:Pro-Pol polyprotein [Dictyocoela roeselum]|nr:Pro-Pol polyprotein [Dictyocoela roeselum]